MKQKWNCGFFLDIGRVLHQRDEFEVMGEWDWMHCLQAWILLSKWKAFPVHLLSSELVFQLNWFVPLSVFHFERMIFFAFKQMVAKLYYWGTNRIDVCQEICLFQKQTAQILIKATDLLIKCSVVISVYIALLLNPVCLLILCRRLRWHHVISSSSWAH